MPGSLRVGSLAGIPLLINPSWLLIFGLFAFILSTQIYPDHLENSGMATHIALGIGSTLLFFVCIVLHELGHAMVAKRFRIPVQSITLFLFGGVAQITREARRPIIEFLIAAAGPLVSLLLGGAFLLAWFLVRAAVPATAEIVLIWLAGANIVLGVFNLLPAFPMDGGRVFRSAVWAVTGDFYRSTVIAAWTGRALYWGIIAVGAITIAGVNTYVANGPIGGIWLILIGFVLDGFARQSLVQTRVLRVLRDYTASDLMQTDLPTTTVAANLGTLARGAFMVNPRLTYYVEDEGRLAGILTTLQVFSVPESNWDGLTVGEAMLPSRDLRAVSPIEPASDVLMEMEAENLTHMPVVDGGRVVGLVGRDGILTVLRRSLSPALTG